MLCVAAYDNRPACQAFPISPWWLSSVTGWSRWCRVRLEGVSRLLLVPLGVLLCDPLFFFFFLLEGVPEPLLPGGESGSFLLCASRVRRFLFLALEGFFDFFFFFLEGVPETPLPVESQSFAPCASRVRRFIFLAPRRGGFFVSIFFFFLEGVPEPPLPGESGSYLLRASRVHLFLFCSPSKGF